MNIVILSDSHGDIETMIYVVEQEKPDRIIYLGDGIEDAKNLGEKFPTVEMISVMGGVDSDGDGEESLKLVEICEKRFIIMHGHTYISYTFNKETKSYMQTDEDKIKTQKNLLRIIGDNKADILLHGHTHEPYINRTQMVGKTCWIMNPGSINNSDGAIGKPVYGVLRFDKNGNIEWIFKEVEKRL